MTMTNTAHFDEFHVVSVGYENTDLEIVVKPFEIESNLTPEELEKLQRRIQSTVADFASRRYDIANYEGTLPQKV